MSVQVLDMTGKYNKQPGAAAPAAVRHSSHRLSKNNLDLLRLIFAGIVCLVHAYNLVSSLWSDVRRCRMLENRSTACSLWCAQHGHWLGGGSHPGTWLQEPKGAARRGPRGRR